MSQVTIPAAQVEFHEGGNTIWVHGPDGATVLRIKCTGRISVSNGCVNICAHADMLVAGDIDVCLPDLGGFGVENDPG